jgi:PAS domain S-box-containing protein
VGDTVGNDDRRSSNQAELRRRAEEIVRRKAAQSSEDLSPEETRHALHELRVHQIELEMQNEELRRAQAELDAARARYFDLYDLAPVGYCTLSEQGLILEANLTAATLLGVARGALCKQPITRFILRDDQDIYYQHRRQLFETVEPQTCELRMVKADGMVFWVQLSTTAARDADGAPVCRAVMGDITERKRAEGRLAQADRLASMGMLAASVSHEINNPLASVLFNIDSLAQDLKGLAIAVERCSSALRQKVGDVVFAEIVGDGAEMLQPAALEDALERAREALEGTQRIREVSRRLGTFSRVESLERSMVDMRSAIESAASMAHNEVRFRARLVKDLGLVPHVWAPEGRLTQVFLNLLVNAAQSIEEGDVERNRIAIRTWAEGGDVFAEVVDSGKGIAPEDLEHIFEPFFTTKGVGVGSGLGLAICKNIVTELGGDLRVESGVGKGSRFVVRLPVSSDVGEPRRMKAVSEESQPVVRGRILVVDDEEAIHRMLTRLLGRDHEIIAAASGEEGRVVLEKDQAFDLILCDLMMPQVSGMELHQWLAQRNPVLAQRVVFITGGAFTPRATEYLASAGNLKIDKPFDHADLKKLIAQLLVAAKSRS